MEHAFFYHCIGLAQPEYIKLNLWSKRSTWMQVKNKQWCFPIKNVWLLILTIAMGYNCPSAFFCFLQFTVLKQRVLPKTEIVPCCLKLIVRKNKMPFLITTYEALYILDFAEHPNLTSGTMPQTHWLLSDLTWCQDLWTIWVFV